MDSADDLLRSQDWDLITRVFSTSGPIPHVVIDDTLSSKALTTIRQALIESRSWIMRRNTEHYYWPSPQIVEVAAVGRALKQNLATLWSECELVEYWAILYTSDRPGRVHADNAKFALTIWLTPDSCNLNPSRGGLLIYEQKAGAVRSFSRAQWAQDHACDRYVRIAYKCNRAVLVDARNYHCTDSLEGFAWADINCRRLSLTFAFDDPKDYKARVEAYGR